MDVASMAGPAEAAWARMAGLRLHLRDTVSVHAHHYRGRPSYLLHDTLGRQQFRLSAGLYRVLTRLDGRHTLAAVASELGLDGPGGVRQELLPLLMQLHAAGMLATDSRNDTAPLVNQRRRRARQDRLSRWLRLLSPRIPLCDPDRLLTRTLPWLGWMFHPATLLVWLAVIAFAGLQALMHWDALSLYGAQRLDDPRGWLLLVALYPLVKGLHELGHGYAAKAGGAGVGEMGVTVLVFVPVPYVDACEASLFANKYRRMLVGGAGILVELLLAALALAVWLSTGDGWLREAAFAVMLIGGVSTLVFNGNPLLRFDGYYVLADWVEIPNLATRAVRYWGYLARRYLLGVRSQGAPATAPGERPWFLFYGAAAFAYRLTISIGIALFLISTIPTLGVLLAAWLLLAQIALPLGRQLHYLLVNPALAGRRARALTTVAALACAGLAALALVPVPSSTRADGVILLPDDAIVRAGVEGFLDRQQVPFGDTVKAGQVLFRLRNPELDRDRSVLRARLDELAARRDAAGFGDRFARDIHAERLAELRAEFAALETRYAGLELRSPKDGVLRGPAVPDRIGRWIEQGDLLAYVADGSRARVRVVALQEDAARIRAGVQRVDVRLAGPAAPTLAAELLGAVPAGSDLLPSAALGSRAGGAIPVDARDDAGMRTLHKVFAFDVVVPAAAAGRFIGSRAHVRFEHAAVPLLGRWYEGLRRLVLSEIGE